MVDHVLVGRLIQNKSLKDVEFVQLAIVGFASVQNGGKIVFVEKLAESVDDQQSQLIPFNNIQYQPVLERLQKEYGFKSEQVEILSEDEFIIPGLIDTHIHAPQYANAGIGSDLQLLDWLNHYTFPTEKLHHNENKDYSQKVYSAVVKRCLSQGTTTSVYFATIFRESTQILADIITQLGQRAWIGKVCMDSNSPDFYIEETKHSLSETEKFIENMNERKSNLIAPIITPRFAPSCSSELMFGLAELAKKYDLAIQTHISENLKEIDWVKALFPDRKSYADIYDHHNLITQRTILAHGCHCTSEEHQLLSHKGAGISHCPISNSMIISGPLHVRKLLNNGVRVGLGTDVSGGYGSSMLDVMRHAILTSNLIQHLEEVRARKEAGEEDTSLKLSWKEVFYLGTIGGSQLLRMEDKLGSIEKGKYFDAIIVNLAESSGGVVDVFEKDTLSDRFQKYLFRGDERNHRSIYVAGRKVFPFQ